MEKSPIDYNRISKALQSTIELIEDENVQMDSEVLGGLLSAKEELTNALAFELFYSNPRNQS
ncbi:hypothetical protein FZC79_06415 [Rossellomorea vietnamensis]|uniref:Uncharacterized protein n=2 Tax=Rossellomorea TaxID=2837508 RepID=A0A5D4KGV0_9BACI|nr:MULTISPECIES: hypothetical protein [Rossellomorea]TYR76511.1 hypothetical protein FZC79_06415 [Rossellomorea vietnamensis]TYS79335.1 hypothetical protein FZC80_10465 [Rossellomorea aquimaris]